MSQRVKTILIAVCCMAIAVSAVFSLVSFAFAEETQTEAALVSENTFENMTTDAGGKYAFFDDLEIFSYDIQNVGEEKNNPINGQKSLKLTGTGSWNTFFKLKTPINAVQGDKITLAFRYRTTPDSWVQLIPTLVENQTSVSFAKLTHYQTEDFQTEVAGNGIAADIAITIQDGYSEAVIEFTANAEAETPYNIYFSTNAAGEFVVDDLKVYKGGKENVVWAPIQKEEAEEKDPEVISTSDFETVPVKDEANKYAIFADKWEVVNYDNQQVEKYSFRADSTNIINGLGALIYRTDSLIGDYEGIAANRTVLEKNVQYVLGFRYRISDNTLAVLTIFGGSENGNLDVELASETGGYFTEQSGYMQAVVPFKVFQDNAYIQFGLKSAGMIAIDDIVFAKYTDQVTFPEVNVPDITNAELLFVEDFEQTTGRFNLAPIGCDTNRTGEMEQKINGKYSLIATPSGEWSTVGMLQTEGDWAVSFKRNTYYTFMLRYKLLTSGTSEFYVIMKSVSGVAGNVSGSICNEKSVVQNAFETKTIEREGYIDFLITLKTGDAADYVFEIGAYTNPEGASYSTIVIDDLRVYEGFIAGISEEDFTEVKKEDASYPVGELTKNVSDFENKNISAGFISVSGDQIEASLIGKGHINGRYSVKVKNLKDDFNSMLFSGTSAVLADHTVYTLQFRTKILTNVQEDAYFYVIAKRSEMVGWTTLKYKLNAAGDAIEIVGTEGFVQYTVQKHTDYYDLTFTFDTGDYDNYYFDIGANGVCEAVYDDFRLFSGGLAEDYETEAVAEEYVRPLSAKDYEVKDSYYLGREIVISLSNLFLNSENIPLEYTCETEGVTFTATSFKFLPASVGEYTVTISAKATDGDETASITLNFNIVEEPAVEPETGCSAGIGLPGLAAALPILLATVFVTIKKSKKEVR